MTADKIEHAAEYRRKATEIRAIVEQGKPDVRTASDMAYRIGLLHGEMLSVAKEYDRDARDLEMEK